ncbi:MAG TPA: hypothetical protein VG165_08065 [Solirubrobacteraceae bacterium]|nr:hypothetical protein [Solirubrobacteraceae bacterium]
MFLETTLVYPVVLALLCIGTGLLVDRWSGQTLPGVLLPAVGVAGLIAVSQLSTAAASTAPATPYVLVAVAVVGFGLGWPRLRRLAGKRRAAGSAIGLPVVVYVIALAPVLLAGRPTFSSYGVLPDSAVHMIGADFLVHHGQDYTRLDLGNSYGEYLRAYFNTSYPSGADTLFGGSALLLRLPLIWAFQPFCAFAIAVAAGPAWLLVRRLGLSGWAAGLAAVTSTLPAIVYGYVLVGSIKEIVSLAMILTLGAFVCERPAWLRGPVTAVIPFAVVTAAGISSLGVGFGAWVIAAVLVLVVWLGLEIRDGRVGVVRSLMLSLVGAVTLIVCAFPTISDLSGSLSVATGIAATANPGNLKVPLRTEQIVGPWLVDSYRHRPDRGFARDLTYALIALTLAAAAAGVAELIRRRSYALGGWLGGMLVVWGGLTAYGTTWVDAKVLMITSPVIMLLAWAGVAGLWRSRSAWRVLAVAVGFVLVGAIAASDAIQYRGSDLAPTARYDELASLNVRFAGQGPTLFTPFDEWSLYELRSMDVGGPDFVYPPKRLTGVAAAHGSLVNLDRVAPAAFAGYPLVITDRDPRQSRPPAAYRLIWEGTYYEVWRRDPGAPTALAHLGLSGVQPAGCTHIGALAAKAEAAGASLVAAIPVRRVTIDLGQPLYSGWSRDAVASVGLVMTPFGHLTADFRVPTAGVWNVWLQGEIMPTIAVSVDRHALGKISGQLDGSEFNPDTMTPFPVRLAAGVHVLRISRGGRSVAPGNGGSALLHAAFVTPAGAGEKLETRSASSWRSLCGRPYDWIEAVRSY